jgi:hypothetical protein
MVADLLILLQALCVRFARDTHIEVRAAVSAALVSVAAVAPCNSISIVLGPMFEELIRDKNDKVSIMACKHAD